MLAPMLAQQAVWAGPLEPQRTASSPVGTLPGTFTVDDGGAARLSIPLDVPPAARGLEPALSLEYDSQSANGPLGVGWSLTGQSAITRCGRTLADDGEVAPIRMTNEDALCLDGRRLVLLEGDALEPGAVYRTPAARQIEAAWGSATYRHGGLMTGMEHVMYRHSASSGFANVSRFADGTTARSIMGYVDAALRYGRVIQNGPAAYTVEYNVRRVIGTNVTGSSSSSIRVLSEMVSSRQPSLFEPAMTANLLDRFLTQECNPYIRRLLEGTIADESAPRHHFEFNLFEVTIDHDNDIAVLQDVLDAADAGVQNVPLTEFANALSRCSV